MTDRPDPAAPAVSGPFVAQSLVPHAVLEHVPGVAFRLTLAGEVLFLAGHGLARLARAVGTSGAEGLAAVVEAADRAVCAAGAGQPARHDWTIGDENGQTVFAPVLDVDGRVNEIAGLLTFDEPDSAPLHAVRRSEAQFRTLVQHSSDLICLVDASMTITYVSVAVEALLGRPPEELTGTSIRSVVHPDDLVVVDGRLDDLLQGRHERPDVFDLRLSHANGSWRTFEMVDTNLFDDPDVQAIVINGRDITDRRRAEQDLWYRATHDQLTGAANRAALLEFLDDQLAVGPAAVVAFGLDRFHVVNDSFGHEAGDGLLVEIADRLRRLSPERAVVARLGGETFMVAIGGVANARRGNLIAHQLLGAFDEVVEVAGRRLVVTARAGVAIAPRGASSPSLVRQADAAMHDAKAHRDSDRVALFDARISAHAIRELELEQALRGAADRGELRVHLQPIVNLADAQLVGIEALVRWDHPAWGLIPPSDFIPLAEETGDIIDIGAWVLFEACRVLAHWGSLADELQLSVNLSPRQLLEPEFVVRLQEILVATGFTADRLTLEVTESVLVEDGPAATHTLEQLRALGVRLAIDDFGTGYSSLVYLRRLHVDTLKIDRSFIDGLGNDPEADAIVNAIIDLAHSLRLDVVAEGVETNEQRLELVRRQCPYAQGFLFSEPLDVTAFARRYLHIEPKPGHS